MNTIKYNMHIIEDDIIEVIDISGDVHIIKVSDESDWLDEYRWAEELDDKSVYAS